MRKSAYLSQLLKLQADASESRAMSSLMRDVSEQENTVLEATSRPWIPGLDLVGKTMDMYSGLYLSTGFVPNTRVIHSAVEGELYKQYQIPSFMQVVEKESLKSDGIWSIDYVTDTMRRRFSESTGFSHPGIGEMQKSEAVKSQSEALLLRGAVSGTISATREHYTLSFQQDWSTEVVSDVLGSGVKTKESDAELRTQMLRDGGGADDSSNEEGEGGEEGSTKGHNNYGPATAITELLLDMVCGANADKELASEKKTGDLSDSATKEERGEKEAGTGNDMSDEVPIVPDCILSERNVILDDDFSRMHAGAIFTPRDIKEKKSSPPGEARSCTAQDIIDGAKILRDMGSHLVVGVTVGGSVTSTVDLSTQQMGDNGELLERNVETTLRHIVARAEKEDIRSQLYYQTQDDTEAMRGSNVLKSQSVSTNPILRHAIANDPIQSVQKWEAEEVEDRGWVNNKNEDDEDLDDNNYNNPFDMSRNPYKHLYSKAYVSEQEKRTAAKKQETQERQKGEERQKARDATRRRRRRRLLNQDDSVQKGDGVVDDEAMVKPNDEDYQVQDVTRTISGGSYMPRSVISPAESDLSNFWETVPQQPGFLSVEMRPLLDVITHSDVIERCFGKSAMVDPPSPEDYPKTVTGRKLMRRKLFWENFLLYMNVKVEALEHNRQKYEVEQKLVQTGSLLKMETIRKFQKFAIKQDKTASGNGLMFTKLGSWQRLSGLIRESKDSSNLLDMLAAVTGCALAHSRSLIHSRAMCRADAEHFQREMLFYGLAERDVPLSNFAAAERGGGTDAAGDGDAAADSGPTPNNHDIPSLVFDSKFLIGAGYQIETECLDSANTDTDLIFSSIFSCVTMEQFALKRLFETMWTLSLDFAVQLMMNEMRVDREFVTSNRGLNNGRKSSTAALCEKEKGKVELEMCFMMEAVLRQAIIEHLSLSSRHLALDPTVELSRLIEEYMSTEPLLFKYRKSRNPKTKLEWTRLEKANTMNFLLFGTKQRKRGFVTENNKLRRQDIIQDGSSAKTKATEDLRNLIGELSKNENEMDPGTVKENIDEMLKSTDESECASFSSLRVRYSSFKDKHTSVIEDQECSVCEYYVNMNRMYGRSSFFVWEDDVSLFPNSNVPSEDPNEGSGPKDLLSKEEESLEGEVLGTLCDRPYFKDGDGLTTLDRAEAKCGGSPFSFIDDAEKKKMMLLETHEETTETLLLETPLDVALAISDPMGGAMLGLTPVQKKIITEMNQKRLKQTMLPKTCEGVSLQPGQIQAIQKQVECIELELKGTPMKASTTKKQCETTVKDLKPLLVSQLTSLSRAAGAPTTILGGEKDPKMSMVVSQIEALRMKVIGPSGFVRPDVPNPNALQDTLLNSNRDPNGANDLCIDLGYCSSTSQMAQKTFIINMIANKDLWEGTDIEKTIKTVVPPSFDPVDLEGGAGGEAAAAK